MSEIVRTAEEIEAALERAKKDSNAWAVGVAAALAWVLEELDEDDELFND